MGSAAILITQHVVQTWSAAVTRRHRPWSGESIDIESDQMTSAASTVAAVPASIIAGLAAGVLSHPTDTIKTLLQGDMAQAKYKNIPGTAKLLMDEGGGVRALYRGLMWRSATIISACFFMNQIKDRVAPVMFPHRFEQQ